MTDPAQTPCPTCGEVNYAVIGEVWHAIGTGAFGSLTLTHLTCAVCGGHTTVSTWNLPDRMRAVRGINPPTFPLSDLFPCFRDADAARSACADACRAALPALRQNADDFRMLIQRTSSDAVPPVRFGQTFPVAEREAEAARILHAMNTKEWVPVTHAGKMIADATRRESRPAPRIQAPRRGNRKR
jgi:hypothetical protein